MDKNKQKSHAPVSSHTANASKYSGGGLKKKKGPTVEAPGATDKETMFGTLRF